MNWKQELNQFEVDKKWDLAIQLLEKVIAENPHDLNAYLRMNYLLMNLLVEEDYDTSKQEYYMLLLKHYFALSYLLFNHNAEYLFFTGITAFISEWFFDIEITKAQEMIKEALTLEPTNVIYNWAYYAYIFMNNSEKKKKAAGYAQQIINSDSIQEYLKGKGLLGNYVLGIIINWSETYLR